MVKQDHLREHAHATARTRTAGLAPKRVAGVASRPRPGATTPRSLAAKGALPRASYAGIEFPPKQR